MNKTNHYKGKENPQYKYGEGNLSEKGPRLKLRLANVNAVVKI